MEVAKPLRISGNDLWAAAIQGLDDEVRGQINIAQEDKQKTINDLLAATERARKCMIDKSLSFKRKNGETVFVRDVLARAAKWINHFKEVGDIIVQYDPAHAALPWAGVRFLLNIAVGDLNTYASVLDGTTKITELLCRNTLLESLISVPRSRAEKDLSDALVKLYASILAYLAKACSYYQQNRFKSLIKSGLFASPDLEVALENIAEAQRNVDSSAKLFGLQDQLESRAELKRMIMDFDAPINRLDKAIHSITDHLNGERRAKVLCWISGEPFEQHHNEEKKEVLKGTGNWLLHEPTFARWKRQRSSSIFWLHGIPGAGKSKLTSFVIEDTRAAFPQGQAAALAYFYCSRNSAERGRSNASKIMASIARQLSAPSPGEPLFKAAIETYNKKEETGFASGPLRLDESKDLILELLKQYNGASATIIIDALDECGSKTRGDLLHTLEDLRAASPCPLKIFVSSREDQDIVYKLAKYPNLQLSSDCNSADIDFFIRTETQRLIDQNDLRLGDREDELRERIIHELTAKAQGMFRWASLQLRDLCQTVSHEALVDRLGCLPSTLSDLHREILTRIETLEAVEDRRFARNALSWLLCVKEQLPSSVFLNAISAKEDGSSSAITRDQILRLCCNLVIYDTSADAFRFAHLSVREFLEQQETYNSVSANALVARICISNFVSTTLGDPTQARFSEYACLFWAEHASAAVSPSQSSFNEILKHFLCGLNFNSWHIAVKDFLDDMDIWQRAPGKLIATISHWPQVLLVVCAYGISGILSREQWIELAKQQPKNTIGETHLEIAAKWGSCNILQWHIDNEIPFEITEDILERVVGNSEHGKEMLALLFDHREDMIEITEDIVRQAVENEKCGKAILELLFDKRVNEIKINAKIVRAISEIKFKIAANGIWETSRNSERRNEMLLMIFERGVFEKAMTKEIVLEIVRSFDEVVLRQLLETQSVDIRITEGLVRAAAENSESGDAILKLLISRCSIKATISEGAVKAIVEKFDHAVFRLLYDKRGGEIPITEEIIEAASKSVGSGDKTLELLFREKRNEVQITERMATVIARNSTSAIFRHLLDSPVYITKITHKVVKAAAQNSVSGKEMLELLLSMPERETKFLDGVSKAAAANYHSGKATLTRRDDVKIAERVVNGAFNKLGSSEEMLELLLNDAANEVLIESEHIEAAALQAAATYTTYGTYTLQMLLDKARNEITIAEKVVKQVIDGMSSSGGSGEAVLSLFLEKGNCNIPITDGVIQGIARKCRYATFQLLLNKLDDEIPAIQQVAEAATENSSSGQEILQRLLDVRGHEITATEKMVRAAARNSGCGKGLLELLFDKRVGEIQITDRVLVAAAGNHRSGREILKLLFRRSRGNLMITDQVVTAAAANTGCGDRILELLVDREGAKLPVTELAFVEAVKAARSGSRCSKSILILLLYSREYEISISEGLIEFFAADDSEILLDILLSKAGRKIQMTARLVRVFIISMRPRELRQLFAARGDEIEVTDELVESAISESDVGMEILRLLLSKPGHRVKITVKIVKNAATRAKDGAEILLFLFKQLGNDVDVTDEVVTAAAGNSGSGKEILELLLAQQGDEITIREEAVIAAARNSSGDKILEMLLDKHGERIHITDAVITAAAGNPGTGKKILELLLNRRGDEIKITGRAVTIAAQTSSRTEILNLLLNQREVKALVTEETIIAAAGNSEGGTQIMDLLLSRKGDDVTITEEVMIAAAGTAGGEETLELFFEHGETDLAITEEVLKAAAGNSESGKKIMDLLLSRKRDDVTITEEVMIAAAGTAGGEEILELFFERGEMDLAITEEVLKAAAGNKESGKKVFELLFERDNVEIQITGDVLKAAAGSTAGILEMLLGKQENHVIITEEVIQAATGNYGRKEKLEMLLEYCERWETPISEGTMKCLMREFDHTMTQQLLNTGLEVPITAEVVEAAITHCSDGKKTLEVLLNKGHNELRITEKMIAAAARHCEGDEILELFFESGYAMDFSVTEEVLEAAAGNIRRGLEVMKLLLDKGGHEIKVTAVVVRKASQNRQSGVRIIELLLDRLGGNFPITVAILTASHPVVRGKNDEVVRAIQMLLFERLWSDNSVKIQMLREAFGNRSITDKLLASFYMWLFVFIWLCTPLIRLWLKTR
ncbi:unnamed protein product [Clonostachys rosea]|uniref:NACHT domain-containing protein n=1 Tax=Bionectria ochroleuca TaxID=29856 RepID=A0ABY6TVZ7_BIOOC|nr:unnamed protein product [Clonostachys rosea]